MGRKRKQSRSIRGRETLLIYDVLTPDRKMLLVQTARTVRADASHQRQGIAEDPLSIQSPVLVIGVGDANERPAGGTVRLTTEWPRLSAMPYALIISVLSVGLLFLIRIFAAGGLSLPVFLLGSIGFVATGLMGCVVIAVKSWRAAVGLRQWQRELEVKPREWVWE
jgi:hypothetical protein